MSLVGTRVLDTTMKVLTPGCLYEVVRPGVK